MHHSGAEYVGSEVSAPVYRQGTIGAAKECPEATSDRPVPRRLARAPDGRRPGLQCDCNLIRARGVHPPGRGDGKGPGVAQLSKSQVFALVQQ
ncbi:hypothetical protein [Streptomyces sp. NPDC002133]|uniref:hypothetical protein n=1 Tax=Streptomyces sp. NPDC002133 TaxID=3154409 RepID=UPI0033307FAB